MTSRKRPWWDGLIYFFNILIGLATLGAYAAYYVSPNLSTVPAFLSLAYPILLGLNALFILYWLLRFQRRILLSLLILGLGYLHIMRFYQLEGVTKINEPDAMLKAMTFNVRSFNKYQWIENKHLTKDITALIRREDPDILFVQEFDPQADMEDWPFPYHYSGPGQKNKRGLVIFSKLPLENPAELTLNLEDSIRRQNVLQADITWRGKKLRLFNVHLASFHLDHTDYQRIEAPNTSDQAQFMKDFRLLSARLQTGFKRRAPQARSLEARIDQSPYPVLMGGDLNATPHSYAYHRLTLELEDAYRSAGSGWASTYHRWRLPLRIDHFLHSASLTATRYQIIQEPLSDHYPVVTQFEWP